MVIARWCGLILLVLALGAAGACEGAAGAEDTGTGGTDAVIGAEDAAVARGDSTAGRDTAGGSDVPQPPLVCPEAITVTEADDVFSAVAAAGWGSLGPYSSGVQPITADLVVQGTLTLQAADFAVPTGCSGRDDCRATAMFVLRGAPAGVTGAGEDPQAWLGGFPSLVVTDATIRLRPLVTDTHPSEYNFVPMLHVLPACGTDCGAGDERRLCPADGACYDVGRGGAYCRLCLGRDKQDCACWTTDGPQEDGESCWFMVSGDAMCAGTCRGGTCRSDEPGWAGCP
jgi:hypothetical protein